MANGHFGQHGAYRVDERTLFYREQEEKRRVQDRITRSELWLGARLAGNTFASEEQMRAHVAEIAATLGYVMDDELAHVIREATTALWQTKRYQRSVAA